MFISRTWHGIVPIQFGDQFGQYLEETGVHESRSISGNVGAYVHRANQGQYTHFFLCTYWQSWSAIRAFAGEAPHIAVTYPEDEKFGLISDPVVIHQEVAVVVNPFIHPATFAESKPSSAAPAP
ncbi:hypothetical protein SAMN05421875_11284 [Acidovorax soli]|uniref:Antibiotic biosynthesis monooxygenase n=1 Tax=Acidovorax soli TaxID=592050 RepID=A0A1H4B351_9BURK|nr:hypothetical protein SAMN05421875_11284 [Acidovorax soli]